MLKFSIIKHSPTHKNSKGDLAPWIIVSESTGKVISSHKTKEQALSHLKDIEGHKNSNVLEINSGYFLVRTADYIDGGVGDDFDLTILPKEELEKGIEVEKEHSPDLGIEEDIVKDHEQESLEITGRPVYYQYLQKAENDMREDSKKENFKDMSYAEIGEMLNAR